MSAAPEELAKALRDYGTAADRPLLLVNDAIAAAAHLDRLAFLVRTGTHLTSQNGQWFVVTFARQELRIYGFGPTWEAAVDSAMAAQVTEAKPTCRVCRGKGTVPLMLATMPPQFKDKPCPICSK